MKRLPVVHPDERYQENYAVRKKLADEARAELDAAIAACGPGADAYCRWTMTDKLGREPDRVFYGCRRNGGTWEPRPPEDNERIEQESVTLRTPYGTPYVISAVTIKGVKYYPFRWELGFSALSDYRPKTAEQMKAAAEARRAKAIAENEAEFEAKQRAAAAHPQLGLPGVGR